MISLREADDGVVLPLAVRPRASRPGSAGEWDGRLKLAVAAPAEEGRANREAVRLVADLFGIPPSAVSLVRGETSPRKEVRLAGLSLGEAERRLSGILSEGKRHGR